METELDRLERLYRELGDEHLQDLATEPEELTDDARVALAKEMQRRGFAPRPASPFDTPIEDTLAPERAYAFGAGVPGILPASGPAVEHALEPGGDAHAGMVSLVSFYDGLELSRACAALEDADISPAIEEIASEASAGAAQRFEVWVDAVDLEAAKQALHQALGLFPSAEAIEEDVEDEESMSTSHDEDAGDLIVAEFDSASEAEGVRAMLVEAGITAAVEPSRTDPANSIVTVPAHEQAQALDLVAERLEVKGS